jgi:acetolactate synthase-1/2/3 large subunit
LQRIETWNLMTEQPASLPEVSEPGIAEAAARSRSGGRIVADALRIHGVDRVFCVPGESFLDILDALHDMHDIQIVVAKHEGAAANMAEADGKLTGRPGICIVTRGPGATHASVGVHTAFQDSTPMLLLIGQVARAVRGREAFQEVEFRQMFAPLAKWVAEIEDAARIPEYMLRAFQCATSGRPGPVVLALPEDVLAEICCVPDTASFRPVQAAPKAEDMQLLRSELARARTPLVIVGGSGWTDAACADLQSFVEVNALPVAASFRRQDLLDNRHPSYIGHLTLGMAPYLARQVRSADLLVAVGTRLGDVATAGYTVVPIPRTHQRLVHIHAGAEELGRVHQADLSINASPALFTAALSDLDPVHDPPWRTWTQQARLNFMDFTTVPRNVPSQAGVDLTEVVSYLAQSLPADAMMSNGAGNYTVWVHRFFTYKRRGTELAPTSGAMGYGLPAAISAKLRYPGRISVCFAGDGCFLMYGQELATARQYNTPVIVIVINNGMYGTIRMHQERRFPGRVSGTDLSGPDFTALAQSFGAYGEKVKTTEAFAPAFERAIASGRPALLELLVDPNQITPERRLADRQ